MLSVRIRVYDARRSKRVLTSDYRGRQYEYTYYNNMCLRLRRVYAFIYYLHDEIRARRSSSGFRAQNAYQPNIHIILYIKYKRQTDRPETECYYYFSYLYMHSIRTR